MARRTTSSPDAAQRDAANEAALQLLETVPLVMRTLRRDVRLPSGDVLSIPRLHALLFIARHPGTDLSGLSDHLGATLPATSELVSRLVAAGFVRREQNDTERRRVSLMLTEAGTAELGAIRGDAEAALAEVVSELERDQLTSLAAALRRLHALLARREAGSGE